MDTTGKETTNNIAGGSSGKAADAMKVTCNLDTKWYTDKTTAKTEMALIKTRIAKCTQTIDAGKLCNAIAHGYAFTPGVLSGTNESTWIQQEIIAADIDNDETVPMYDDNGVPMLDERGRPQTRTVRCADPMTLDDILATLAAYNLRPWIIYETMSSTPEWKRYRVMLCMDTVITDADEMKAYNASFQSIFRGTDTSVKNLDRVFFGTDKADKMVYTALDNVTALADIQAMQLSARAPAAAGSTPSMVRPTVAAARERKTYDGRMAELKDQEQCDIDTFDLAAYIMRTTSSTYDRTGKYLDPCPLCGHKGHFQVTGAMFHSYSSHDQIDGKDASGTIIHYLMYHDGMDIGAAHEYFKFDIMKYDRKEWKNAMQESYKPGDRTTTYDFDNNKYTMEMAADGSWHDANETPADKTNDAADAIGDGDAKKTDETCWIDAFMDTVRTERYKPISTGMDAIDAIIGGGLMRQQMSTLGAAPGMGKTAFAQMLFDTMATNGIDIVYFNFEMSREQMLARSLSRDIYATTGMDVNALGIMQGYKWTDAQDAAITDAVKRYKASILPHLTYNPGPGATTKLLDDIMGTLDQIAAERSDNVPIVVIDYLQMIRHTERYKAANGAMVERAADDVTTIKLALQRLKDYAIKNNTHVFIITANNRASNKTGNPGMDAGRDTSNIEYSGDLQLAIGYTAMMYGANTIKTVTKPKADGSQDQTPSGTHIYPKDVDDLQQKVRDGILDENELKRATLKVNKARFAAPNGTVRMAFDGAHSTYTIERTDNTPRRKQTDITDMWTNAVQHKR